MRVEKLQASLKQLLRDVQEQQNQILVIRELAARAQSLMTTSRKRLHSTPYQEHWLAGACSDSVHYIHPPDHFAGTKALSFSFERAYALLLKGANFQKLR